MMSIVGIARCADGEGRDVGLEFGKRPAHERGIDSAAEQRANRDIRNQAQFHRFDQQPLGFFHGFFETEGGALVGFREGPINPWGRLGTVGAPFEKRGGRKLAYAGEYAAIVGDETEVQELERGLQDRLRPRSRRRAMRRAWRRRLCGLSTGCRPEASHPACPVPASGCGAVHPRSRRRTCRAGGATSRRRPIRGSPRSGLRYRSANEKHDPVFESQRISRKL